MFGGLFQVDAQPGRLASLGLSWFLFAAAIGLYFYASHARHLENPGDRVIPGFSQLGEGITSAFLNPPEDAEAAPEEATAPEGEGAEAEDNFQTHDFLSPPGFAKPESEAEAEEAPEGGEETPPDEEAPAE